jgi:hypothetical protein
MPFDGRVTASKCITREELAMPRYLVLIYDDETQWEKASQADFQDMMARHNRFSEQVNALDGGKILGGEALTPTNTATTIRDDIVTDGPFAETKEALGGYYLVEAKDLDQALEIGKLCPVNHGGVEVRPIMEF